MKNSLFISFEGPDGSGKSTQIAALKEYFEEKNIDVVMTREPGGTAIGEKIRAIILDKENVDMNAMTEALLYAASRAQHVAQVIKPALLSGKTVICDRFVDSSIAYQGFGRGLGDSVRVINEYAVAGCIPDVTFLLLIAPELGKERVSSRVTEEDRLEREKLEFHRRVYDGYRTLAENEPRIVVIDATREIEEIRRDIIEGIEAFLALRDQRREE